ncbi:MAG: PIN domain-containing protein [Candidatus Micrarchaeia archaeon]
MLEEECNIIIDTSSILFGFTYNKDIFELVKISYPNCKIIISKGIIRELKNIAKSTGKRGVYAKTALEAIKHKDINIVNDNNIVDEWIYKYAQSIDAKVVTNDTELYKRLKDLSIKCMKMTVSGNIK